MEISMKVLNHIRKEMFFEIEPLEACVDDIVINNHLQNPYFYRRNDTRRKTQIPFEILNEAVHSEAPKNCIYFLKQKNNIIYIGKTISLYSRLISHWSEKVFDNIEVIFFNSENDMHIIEPYLISLHRPILNKEFISNDTSISCQVIFKPTKKLKINSEKYFFERQGQF